MFGSEAMFGKLTRVAAGEWCENKMHGQGMYTYANSDMYTGAFEHGVKNGEGSYYFEVRSGPSRHAHVASTNIYLLRAIFDQVHNVCLIIKHNQEHATDAPCYPCAKRNIGSVISYSMPLLSTGHLIASSAMATRHQVET